MTQISIFPVLESITHRPEPFSRYTAQDLWADEHRSGRMLDFHLDGEVDISSRRTDFIEDSVSWMTRRFGLGPASRIIDFGCGPGLYTSRFSGSGAEVHGVDFSSRSVAYARQQASERGDRTRYVEADYLEYQPDGEFDLATMIMCDFCALSPGQRRLMLEKFRRLLSPNGRVVLDAYSLRAFENREESTRFGKDLMQGFWSPNPYFGFATSLRYEEDKVVLDKYTIVERDAQMEVYNWLQYFSPQSLEREVVDAGLAVEELLGNVAGAPFDADAPEFAVVLKAPG